MTKPSRWNMASPIKFKGETTMKDHETGKVFDATVIFTSLTGIEVSEDKKTVSFGVDNTECVYEIIIHDKETSTEQE